MEIQHLALLVGTNPLPNYVVAKYFLETNLALHTIWLIYTTETESIAERLKTGLKKYHPRIIFKKCYLSAPGDAKKIRHEITNAMKSVLKSDESIHLNYTGGTKSMAVQSYRTVFTEVKDILNVSFSYLDTRDFILKSDDNTFKTDDLRGKIRIDIEDLLKLHDCRTKGTDSSICWDAPNQFFSKLTKFVIKC